MEFYEPICGKCAVTMRCDKNGVVAVWNVTHRRRGDMFKCPECGAMVLRVNNNAYHEDTPLEDSWGPYLEMND